MVYALSKIYKISREDTSAELTKFCNLKSIKLSENDVIKYAIKFYSERSLDLADCLLAGYNLVYGYEVRTFDQKLVKLLKSLGSDT